MDSCCQYRKSESARLTVAVFEALHVDSSKEEKLKERNILIWYIVGVITFGIGFVVWYYKINKDAKILAENRAWSPGLSVVAITIGSVLVIPPIVSHWRTWSRVREAVNVDGLSAGLQFCFVFLPLINLAYWGYLQSKLNSAVSVPASAAVVPV
jgi:membrane protease YdiL (CAAX protease family)